MREFKIRASAIGKIMTNPRSKSETLSKTTMTYCEEWTKEQIYGRRKEFSNKYTQKGQIMEDNSLDFIAEQLGYPVILKNEEYYENEFITGTPDAVLEGLVIDVKNSWDCFTFPLFETEIPTSDYYWQAQGYMALTGIKKFKLIYVLSDTPEHLIDSEYRRHLWSTGEEEDAEVYQQFVDKMTYTNIEDKYKIKIFDIEYNEEDVQKIIERVKECRTYIEQLCTS